MCIPNFYQTGASVQQVDKYIVTKEEIDAREGIQKTHFLNANARRINKSLGDLAGINGFGFHLSEVEPGRESTELHRHYHEDECIYILEGEAEAAIGDTKHAVKAGDFIGYRAGGEAHQLRNTGTGTLKCIVVGQRLDHDVGLRCMRRVNADAPARKRSLMERGTLAILKFPSPSAPCR